MDTCGGETKEKVKDTARTPAGPRQILCVLIVACLPTLNGMISGWTAVLPKLQEDTTRFTVTVQDVTWLASLNLVVSIGASPLAGTLGEHVGPCRLLFLAMCPVPGLWFIQAYTPWVPLLYVCRAALAVSTSVFSTIVQPLIAELSPVKIRGLAGTLPAVMACAGMLLSYVLAYLLPWDVATAVSAAPFMPLVLLMLLVPESPYWLVRKKRIDAAERSLRVLLGHTADVTKELDAIRSTTTLKQANVMNQLQELRRGRNIRPVVLITALFILRELGGKAPVFSYTVYMFRSAEVELDAFYCTVFVGLTRFGGTLMSAFILDCLGRKPVLVTSAVISALALAVAGITVFLEVEGASWVTLVSMLAYVGAHAIGVGPIPWGYLGELLPTPVRSMAASIITTFHFSSSFGINYMFLEVVATFGLGRTLMVFGSLNLAIAIISFCFIPETKGRSLQDMEKAFVAKGPKEGKDNLSFEAEEQPPLTDSLSQTQRDSAEATTASLASSVSSRGPCTPSNTRAGSCTPPRTSTLPCIPLGAIDGRSAQQCAQESKSRVGDRLSSSSSSDDSSSSASVTESTIPAFIQTEKATLQTIHL